MMYRSHVEWRFNMKMHHELALLFGCEKFPLSADILTEEMVCC